MKKVLIVVPHPDDAELTMGGTIAKMIAAGWNVIVAVIAVVTVLLRQLHRRYLFHRNRICP